jgi:hypothetical protein
VRRTSLALAFVVAAGVVAASLCPLAGAAVAQTTPTGAPTPPSGLAGNVDPTVDTSASTVAVAASSAPVDDAIAVLVRNGTTHPVNHLRVSAIAVAPDGGSAAKAKAVDVVPGALAPGDLALARLAFHHHELPAGAKITYAVKSKQAASGTDPGTLAVQDLQLGPPLIGSPAQRLTMTLANAGRRTVAGPVTATVVCFGEAATPSFAVTAAVKKARVKAGHTLPLTVDLDDLCPSYLVAAHGVAV